MKTTLRKSRGESGRLSWGLVLIMVLGLSTIAAGGTGLAAEPAHKEDQDQTGWEFIAAPYLWLPGLSGEIAILGQESTVEAGLSDVLENLDFGAMLHLEARKDRFALYLNPLLVLASARGGLGPFNLEARTEFFALEFGILYSVFRSPKSSPGSRFSLWVLAGGRYVNLRGELTIQGVNDFGQGRDWLDPFLGLRLRADLSDRLSLTLNSDTGGYGLGSEFSFNGMVQLGYRFNKTFSLWAGYRVLYIDYREGPPTNLFAWDITMAGPVLGGAIVF